MIPFAALGYHEMPAKVSSCTLCHESKSQPFETMHQNHRNRNISCNSCHHPDADRSGAAPRVNSAAAAMTANRGAAAPTRPTSRKVWTAPNVIPFPV